jgi:hypothetical protein
LSFETDVANSQLNGFRARKVAEMGITAGANPTVKPEGSILQLSNENGDIYRMEIRSDGEHFGRDGNNGGGGGRGGR